MQRSGQKRGLWCCHEFGVGGDPLQLIRFVRRCDFAEAVKWARDWCGDVSRIEPAAQPGETLRAEHVAKQNAEQAQRISAARRMWDAGEKPTDLVDAYLITARGIPKPTAGWPDAVRLHRPSSALMVAATSADDEVQAVQRIRLTPDGRKAGASAEQPTKISNGVLAGAAVRLPGDPSGPLLLAEGPETGLSVWAATGHEIWVALGSVAGLTLLPADRRVVVCRDDDPVHSPADKRLTQAVHAWRQAGLRVTVATPWADIRGDRSDFNNTIIVGGPDAVRARIDAALFPPGSDGRRRLPITAARPALDHAVGAFFEEAGRHDPVGEATPPVHAIKIDVGVGKSLAARNHAASLLIELRGRDDARSVTLLVPTHALGAEQAAAFETLPAARDYGLTAAVWRGRAAPDPDVPGQTMCRDLDAVHDAQAAGAAVQSAVCRKRLANGEVLACPHFGSCGYQRQRNGRADLWIGAHEMLFSERPSAFGELAALVVDEAAWQDGLEGVCGPPVTLALDALEVDDPVPGDPVNTARLAFLRRLALDALRAMPHGPVLRAHLMDAGITPENAAEAGRLEWMRKAVPDIRPGMAPAVRKAAVEAAQGNRLISRHAALWRALEALTGEDGPAASGWVDLGPEAGPSGVIRVLRLKGRKLVRDGWQVPTLLLDATLDADLVRPFWPGVRLTADIAVETPHQRVRQVVDCSFSRRRLIAPATADAAARTRCAKKLRELHAVLAGLGRRYAPGRVLVVVQQAIEQALPAVGRLPGNIELAHHNAVAGRDEWKNVAALVVVGRTAPPPADVSRLAEALTGSAIPVLAGWYDKSVTARYLTDGHTIEAGADRHPDPIAEAIRWSICEGELVQIIGRGRGVNRTESDPLDILVMTNVPLPIPIDETLSVRDLDPSPYMLMLAVGGIAFTTGAEAFAAYPTLFSSVRATQKFLERSEAQDSLSPTFATFPNKKTLLRECRKGARERTDSGLLRVDFQVAGRGRRATVAWFDPELITDPVAALVRMVGPVAWCQVIEAPIDPASDTARAGPQLASDRLPPRTLTCGPR